MDMDESWETLYYFCVDSDEGFRALKEVRESYLNMQNRVGRKNLIIKKLVEKNRRIRGKTRFDRVNKWDTDEMLIF